jgi:hypothetical protein
MSARLKAEIEGHIGAAGKVIEAIYGGPGVGWTVVLDTEYAALKVFYAYRRTKGLRLGESRNLGGWFVSVDPAQ